MSPWRTQTGRPTSRQKRSSSIAKSSRPRALRYSLRLTGAPHGQCLGRDAQLGQGSHRVARQVDTHPPRNRWAPLDDGAAQPMPAHRPRDGSPCDPAADDEDRTGHRPSPSRPARKRLVAAMGPVFRRSGYTSTPNRAHTRPDRVKGLVTETWNWRRSSVARRSAQSNRIADILHAQSRGSTWKVAASQQMLSECAPPVTAPAGGGAPRRTPRPLRVTVHRACRRCCSRADEQSARSRIAPTRSTGWSDPLR